VKYEYMVIHDEKWNWKDATDYARHITNLLNMYSQDGWEFIRIYNTMIYFRRPKEPVK
jgi:hypothetical protein